PAAPRSQARCRRGACARRGARLRHLLLLGHAPAAGGQAQGHVRDLRLLSRGRRRRRRRCAGRGQAGCTGRLAARDRRPVRRAAEQADHARAARAGGALRSAAGRVPRRDRGHGDGRGRRDAGTAAARAGPLLSLRRRGGRAVVDPGVRRARRAPPTGRAGARRGLAADQHPARPRGGRGARQAVSAARAAAAAPGCAHRSGARPARSRTSPRLRCAGRARQGALRRGRARLRPWRPAQPAPGPDRARLAPAGPTGAPGPARAAVGGAAPRPALSRMAIVHVIGAGLAGLAAAVRLARRGQRVALYEAAQQAGGRCRSFFDRTLGRVIDNGNHLLLSGNRSACAYLDAIGAADTLIGPPDASFPFLDLATGERWTVRPNRGPLPFWVLMPSRRVPGTRFRDYLATRRLWRAGERHTVADCLRTDDVLWRRFWSPLATAVLNTPPTLASARLLRAALEESFARGAAGCRPLIARTSLAASLIDPALTFLRRHGVEIGFGQRLRAIELDDRRARSLDFGQRRVDLGPGDAVILALPPGQAAALLPGLVAPQASHTIVNGHFR